MQICLLEWKQKSWSKPREVWIRNLPEELPGSTWQLSVPAKSNSVPPENAVWTPGWKVCFQLISFHTDGHKWSTDRAGCLTAGRTLDAAQGDRGMQWQWRVLGQGWKEKGLHCAACGLKQEFVATLGCPRRRALLGRRVKAAATTPGDVPCPGEAPVSSRGDLCKIISGYSNREHCGKGGEMLYKKLVQIPTGRVSAITLLQGFKKFCSTNLKCLPRIISKTQNHHLWKQTESFIGAVWSRMV